MPNSITTIQKIVQSVNNASDLSTALNRLVHAIYQALGVDVCSIYLNDKINRNYVLMATHGLNPEAVGNVILNYDEGLVGLVGERSEPINIENASSHSRFKYIPESGEERYHSFVGIPVIQQGELLAVLVVQQVSPRRFDDQDLAFLTTLAALIAGNIAFAKARGEIDSLMTDLGQSGGLYKGIAAAPGLCIGTGIVAYTPTEITAVPDRKPEDIEEEEKRFHAAVDAVVEELAGIRDQLVESMQEADRLLFDAYSLIARDEELIKNTLAGIRAGNWAQGALRETIQWYADQFDAMDNPYLKERANDIRDIGRRILGHLQSEVRTERRYPDNTVLIGENLSPLDIATVPPECLAGIVSGHGSAYSHLAILAHALNIPAVSGFAGHLPLSRLEGKTLVIDGYKGYLHVAPNAIEMQEYEEMLQGEEALAEQLRSLRDKPATTRDGLRIHLFTNSGLLAGYTHAHDVGTEGIGLYRTELPFMSKDSFPSEDEQYQLYRAVLEAYAPLPVTLRTLDIGGDKVLPYFPINEPNPFLGWRGIRVSLDHPEIFLTQARAMLRANEGLENLKILLPMISGVGEIDRAVVLLKRAYNEVLEEGLAVPYPEIGTMIEVPSTIYQIPAIAKRVDFLSIGSNDLVQYLLAIDRNNELVAELFEPLHPSVLEALSQIATAARKARIPLSICGEAAGDPAVAIMLIAMQFDSLSLSAGDLPRIKWVIRSFSYEEASKLWRKARRMDNPADIRRLLHAELEQHGLKALLGPAA
ncbi:MAG: phosphoenolpyruvate--protein phosphotransferase [Gammaproteobacteria bacterium]